MELLTDIYGIGPVLAKDLLSKYPALKKMVNAKDIRAYLKHVEIFGTLPIAAQMDLTYSPLKNIPREIIYVMDYILRKRLQSSTEHNDREFKFVIAGSYIRGKPISHDIDLVLERESQETLHQMISQVNRSSKVVYINHPYALGKDKATCIFQILVPRSLRNHELIKDHLTIRNTVYVKVDIFTTPKEEYIYALLFAIGSGSFNIRMRAVAKKRGYLLNQRGLYKRDPDGNLTLVKGIHNEEDIFNILNMTYKTPEERLR